MVEQQQGIQSILLNKYLWGWLIIILLMMVEKRKSTGQGSEQEGKGVKSCPTAEE